MSAAPVTSRISLIDALRGMALCGILIPNLEMFCGFPFENELGLPVPSEDRLTIEFVNFFLLAKFYTLFSLMFGVSLSLQISNLEKKGGNIWRVHLRRMGLLFMIGALHATLIWFGDILMLYALVGMLLPLFRNWSNQRLGIAIVILMVLPLGYQVLMAQLLGPPQPPTGDNPLPDMYRAISTGTYTEMVASSPMFIAVKTVVYNNQGRFFKIPALFLLGYMIGRSGILQNIEPYLARIRRLLPVFLILGMLGNGLMYHFKKNANDFVPTMAGAGVELGHLIGVPTLSLAYVMIFILWRNRSVENGLWHWFVPYGRMALTNYIMQSVICTFLFDGWGLGLMVDFSFTLSVLMAFPILLAQILFSKWWMNRFAFGPLEWLWRCLTYGRQFAILKA